MAGKKPSVLNFKAQVFQVKTLVDGGYRVSIDLSENEIEQVANLLECKKRGAILEVAAVPVFTTIEESKRNAQKDQNDKGRKTRKRQRYPYRG